MNKVGFIGTTVLLLLALLSSTMFVVDQRQFGVVNQFGQIQKVITEPGLNFKLPLVQNVNYLDKRLLTLDSMDTEPMLTAEKQRVVIDWYVRWRITDPKTYIQNVSLGGDESAGATQLNRVVRNAFQEEINRRTVRELISTRRETLMDDVKRDVTEAVTGANWGVDIVDVRITRADYVESITESVYRRMQAERERVANELRATGAAEGEQIRADADRQREVTVANAYRDAEKVRGEGDAEATRVYGEAFGRDPQFAEFYRSLDAYKASIGQKGDVLVIDPQSSDFFRNLRGAPSRR
ncbi:MAG: protease modulator HflC [Pseudomonadota bacterium]|nr:protease modulator HflC [Pseudomonadota bacterium]